MSRFRMLLVLVALICIGTLSRESYAQRRFGGVSMGLDSHRGTATVTGTVIDQDSQHPVRLAEVSLVPVVQTAGHGNSGGFGRTGIDGVFMIDHVTAGDYYVLASASGYVAAKSLLEAQISAGSSVDDVLHALPMVHVNDGGTAEVTVTIERGAVIGGTVQWDDGLPAAGVRVSYIPVQMPSSATTDALLMLTTRTSSNSSDVANDRGSFRLAGLAPGDYMIVVSFISVAETNYPSVMTMYYPGVFRYSEAKPISVRLGSERTDLQMTLDLSTLHTVSGTVSASSGTASVKSGTVSLRDTNDATFRVYGAIGSDGTFAVKYVPPGTYTMTVNASSFDRMESGPHHTEDDSSVAFASASQSLTVTSADVTGLAISVDPKK